MPRYLTDLNALTAEIDRLEAQVERSRLEAGDMFGAEDSCIRLENELDEKAVRLGALYRAHFAAAKRLSLSFGDSLAERDAIIGELQSMVLRSQDTIDNLHVMVEQSHKMADGLLAAVKGMTCHNDTRPSAEESGRYPVVSPLIASGIRQ